MKQLLSLAAILFCVSVLSTSCHQRYACYCHLKDTTAVNYTPTLYAVSATTQSAADVQCMDVQSQHAGDTCHAGIFRN